MRKTALILIGLISLSGCATVGSKTGNLGNYEHLSKGKYLAGFYKNSALNTRQISKISISPIKVEEKKSETGISTDLAALHLKTALESSVISLKASDRFIFKDDPSADARLDIVINEINPGSRQARMWFGEYGAGHAYLQVEGRLIDRDGIVLAEFSERRRNSGDWGMQDSYMDAGPNLLKEMLETIAQNIIKEFEWEIFHNA